MKVYNRYNSPKIFPHFILGDSKTEVGLSTPLAVLAERFKQGKEVPKLNGNIDLSLPFQMKFGYDLNDRFDLLTKFSDSITDFATKCQIDNLEKKLKDEPYPN